MVNALSVQSPLLSVSGTTALTSPVHFQATAESDLTITGYVIYVDDQNVFQNFVQFLDAWVVLPPNTTHTVYVKAWDTSGSLASTPTYTISVSGLAVPQPPVGAWRMTGLDGSAASWTVDNNPGVGGDCNDGSIGSFASLSDPNTSNSPDFRKGGMHFLVKSTCKYDDSLFYRKDKRDHSQHTNFLWDFWFYIPGRTETGSLQALEFDLFQAVQLYDGVHEFMFGSQCNFATNQWQIWLPKNGRLSWENAGLSPCQFSTGTWHHATYFLQRVSASGYQVIPSTFSPTSDTNSNLLYGTLTIDGNTMYLGAISYSTVPQPSWSPVLGIQHQLDSALAGVTIEEYVAKESLVLW